MRKACQLDIEMVYCLLAVNFSMRLHTAAERGKSHPPIVPKRKFQNRSALNFISNVEVVRVGVKTTGSVLCCTKSFHLGH